MTVRVLESRIHDYLGMAMRYSWAGEGARDFKTQYVNNWFPQIVQGGAEEEKGVKTRMARVNTRLTRHAKWDTYLELKYNLNSQLNAHVNSRKDRKQLINNSTSHSMGWQTKEDRASQSFQIPQQTITPHFHPEMFQLALGQKQCLMIKCLQSCRLQSKGAKKGINFINRWPAQL